MLQCCSFYSYEHAYFSCGDATQCLILWNAMHCLLRCYTVPHMCPQLYFSWALSTWSFQIGEQVIKATDLMGTSLGIISLFQKQFFVLGCCLSFIVLMAKISHKLLSSFFFGGGVWQRARKVKTILSQINLMLNVSLLMVEPSTGLDLTGRWPVCIKYHNHQEPPLSIVISVVAQLKTSGENWG